MGPVEFRRLLNVAENRKKEQRGTTTGTQHFVDTPNWFCTLFPSV